MKLKKLLLLVLAGIFFLSNVYAEQAIFAMGCFWCAESEFRNQETNRPLPGIESVTVGYAGGTIKAPTYAKHPGYKEAIKIEFDPAIIAYSKLLDIFWHNIDPFDAEGQFCDQGFPYTAVIYYSTDQQKKEAELSKNKIEQQFKRSVKTTIIAATTFYDAEAYHQNYANKNPTRYKFYRWNCGRDQRLKQIWGE